MDSKEKISSSQEAFNEAQLAEKGHEQNERLREERERAAELSHEQSVDEARSSVERASELLKSKETTSKQPEQKLKTREKISKSDREQSFKNTMAEVHTQMSAPSRTFSRFIHSPVIEKTSEVIGGTIARPNAILTGSLFAFFATLVVYLVARYYGYALSGAETIISFALGWVIGLIFDYLVLLVRGKR